MLFSSDPVVKFIHDTFEPAWESLGPVPKVTIDFGNGKTITRTLNGNVATYVCLADGSVLDVLPGIYAPAEYRRQLEQLFLLTQFVQQENRRIPEPLKWYHQNQAESLKNVGLPGTFVLNPGGGASILGREEPVRMMMAGRVPAPKPAPDELPGVVGGSRAMAAAPGWRELAEDTRYNETVRRRLVHAKLATMGKVQPKDVVKWLYKEVLNTDLDDETLGVADILNRRTPFIGDPPKP